MEYQAYQEKDLDMVKTDILLKARNVTKWFPIKKWFFEEQRYIKALDNVSLEIYSGETLGIVGESGCGKSTLARTLLRLIEPTKGIIEYEGKNILNMGKGELRRIRRRMQMVFQDPYSSLHPKMKIGQIIAEPFIINGLINDKRQRKERILELMEMVGLDSSYIERYPHEFSGGQRQRIVIARALATTPNLLVCDEPVSAMVYTDFSSAASHTQEWVDAGKSEKARKSLIIGASLLAMSVYDIISSPYLIEEFKSELNNKIKALELINKG